MGLWESALILVGVGIVSSRFKAGVGLGELGAGIQSLVSAPLSGTGVGLSSLAGGIRDISETFGDLGRGLSDLFAAIPKLPAAKTGPPQQPGALPGNGLPPIIAMSQPLIASSGGDVTTQLAGGGGSVPTGYQFSLGEPSAYIKQYYSVIPGSGNGIAGWYVSISPVQNSASGGTVNL